ncbi:acidic mammalian chitinase-like [Neocloeon triangulifer]|uniref:acidic mammalian chitinase-like n=1 Tax=Neocloeon triangulifer TaxID=2078957 RepID=UPI00286EB4B2|nr:acidic mammalian chitinase-like [Neocloeon triangulifer]XP_059488792.1 acidic mammalian chitinase-like [Neocloeon triangulifer]
MPRSTYVTLALLLAFSSLASAQKKVVCYYGSWANYRTGVAQFNVTNIDPFLCTHVIYAFIGANTNGTVKILDSWNDVSLNGFKDFNNLRLKNANLKTMVALGGWSEGSATYSTICNNVALRTAFVTNLYNFLVKWGFNGLDIDWEYPAQRGGIAADKANFASLIKELRAKFTPANLLLSAAFSADINSYGTSYDVPTLATNLDFINLMTYDFHSYGDGKSGENSPLYAASIDTDKTMNSDATVQYWIKQGVDKMKIVLGVPLYGRSFTLKSATSNGLGAVTVGAGALGPWSQEAGLLMFSEICMYQKNQTGWTVQWNAAQQVPYAYRSTLWVGYENKQSVEVKGKYAKDNGLGGVMVWAIDYEDFRNFCGGGKFPLISALKANFTA